ncbi:MAG TPA: Ig domain-containing protein [Nitrospira sp.]|nr:Ig domain-containing protein [Nitrospira sp.]
MSITTTSLPEGAVNEAYSASLSGSGGALPYTWSVSPGLPANLSLDTATGAITGTPTTQATTTHPFTLRDSSAPSQTVQQTLSLTIRPTPAVLAITTTSLPNGTVNQAYNRPVQASGGTPPLTWNIVAGTGTLPPGLNLDPATGAISGTPTTAGTASFTIRVADARGQSDTQGLSITIGTAPPPPNPPNITTTTLAAGTVGQPYSQPVQATGGTGALTWSISVGTLPPGLNLNPINGVISGTPTAAGTSSFTVRVQDAGGLSDTQALSITINQPAPPPSPSITTTSLPAGTIGQAYNQTLLATGGTGGLTWSIVAGNLPGGLNLNQTTGVISGTPLAPAGTSSFTVRVADAAGQDDTQALSITVNLANPPVITTTTLPGGTVGQVYSQTLQVTGGIGILTWTLSGGSLPAMLSLSPDGVISGTPTNTGTANFTVRVTDTLNQFDTQSLSIAVSAALAITTDSLPAAREGDSYRRTLQRSGGVAPFTWSVAPPLPDGLNLNPSTGEITGTPATGTEGTYDLTFAVQDSSAPTPQTASKLLELRIRD